MSRTLKQVVSISDLQQRLIDRAGPFPAPGRVIEGGTTDHIAGRPGHRRRRDGDRDDDNFNPDGLRKRRNEHKPEYDVKLVCRTFVGDIGNRPLSNMVFWESPDIWIEGSSGDPDVATPGEVNQVKVHVWNMGLADSWGTTVDLYWCDPSVGINAAVASPIGSQTLSLFSGQHQILSFDWVPEFVNHGHECLVAHVYDPVSDPISAPFNPVQDRHVGQRNISVLDVTIGKMTLFEFFSQNLSLSPATTDIEIHRLDLEAFDTVAMALGTRVWRNAAGVAPRLNAPIVVGHTEFAADAPLATGVFRETLQGIPGVSERQRVYNALRSLVAPSQVRAQKRTFNRNDAAANVEAMQQCSDRLERGVSDRVVWQADGSTAGRLALAPGRHYKLNLELEVPADARRGTDIFRVVEKTAGQITGGITLVVRTS